MNQETNQEEIWNKLYNSKIEHLRSIYLLADTEKKFIVLRRLEKLLCKITSSKKDTYDKEKSAEVYYDQIRNPDLVEKINRLLEHPIPSKVKCIIIKSGGYKKAAEEMGLNISHFRNLVYSRLYIKKNYKAAKIAHWLIEHGYAAD